MIVQDSHWIAYNFEILLVAIVRWVFHGVSRVEDAGGGRPPSQSFIVCPFMTFTQLFRENERKWWVGGKGFFFFLILHSFDFPPFFPLKILNSLSMEHTRIYTVWPAVCVGSAAARYNTTRIVSSSWLILLSFSYFISQLQKIYGRQTFRWLVVVVHYSGSKQ